MKQQAESTKVTLKITFTQTVKIEVTKADAEKKTACCCATNCKR